MFCEREGWLVSPSRLKGGANLRVKWVFTETKKHSPNTGARANNTLHKQLGYPVGEPARQSACEARPSARHVFLWQSHKNTNNAFRLFNPVYDMHTYIFKVIVFTKQAKYK